MSSMSVRVLTMVPAAPASMQPLIWAGLLVGSMEATTTGFLKVSPQNSTWVLAIGLSSAFGCAPAGCRGGGSSLRLIVSILMVCRLSIAARRRECGKRDHGRAEAV